MEAVDIAVGDDPILFVTTINFSPQSQKVLKVARAIAAEMKVYRKDALGLQSKLNDLDGTVQADDKRVAAGMIAVDKFLANLSEGLVQTLCVSMASDFVS